MDYGILAVLPPVVAILLAFVAKMQLSHFSPQSLSVI